MNEYDIIRTIAAQYSRSKDQLNRLFECDAELIRIGDQVWGLTMDDFSPEEDFFTSEDPSALGANLAVATISDLLAAGVEPRFFMHALSLPQNPDVSFIDGLAGGIATVLKNANCTLCGGDIGRSDNWRYCGFAMGPVVSSKPVTHRMSAEPQTLWVTGELGDANLAAFRKGPTPPFQLRLKEAEVIRKHATACIDTSGGLMDAIWILHEMNPEMRFEIHADKIPLAPGVLEFSRMTGIPPSAALLGGAGEYELLFATQNNLVGTVGDALAGMGITPVGEVTVDGASGIYICRNGQTIAAMTDPAPCPRAVGNTSEHVKEVIKAATVLFGNQ